MKVLDLFSGIGGFSLGLEWAGMNTVAFCEQNTYCQKILNKHWPDVPVYPEIKKLTYERLKQDGIRTVDLICGGFPCQPFSVAGLKRGTEDDRYLWPEMLRIISEIKPDWVIGENVAGFVNMALDRTLFDLEKEGYETATFIIPACSLNAKHQRDRVWIIAHKEKNSLNPKGQGTEKRNEKTDSDSGKNATSKIMADTKSRGWREQCLSEHCCGKIRVDASGSSNGQQIRKTDTPVGCSCGKGKKEEREKECGWQQLEKWETEPDVGRVVDGFPGRVDRLKALGNAVVPQIVFLIGMAIIHSEQQFNN